jgi:glycosyltransferase involved in cell wall biosynthesis
MNKIRTSVIISTYNRPSYLWRVIDGYLGQTLLPDEIIIADDGSTEATGTMISKIQSESSVDIKHVWHEDCGFRAAAIRNRAAAASIGDYLIFADDDAVPSVRLLEDHLHYAEKYCFIQGHRVLLDSATSETFCMRDGSFSSLLSLALTGKAANTINALRLPIPFIRKSRNMNGIRSCNMSLYRSDFLAVNGFNEDFVGWGKEDSELAVRLYKNGIMRKDLKFRACCFHLYHAHFDRDNLKKNINLLEAAQLSTTIYCANGADKYLNNSSS